MSEEKEIAKQPRTSQRARASGGRALAVLALFIGLAAVGAAAYLYTMLEMLKPSERIDGRIAALESAHAKHSGDLRRLGEEQQMALNAVQAEQQRAIDALRAEQERQRRATEASLAQALEGLAVPASPQEPRWELAEVEYLLLIANHRVTLEGDAKTALRLLQSASGILGGIDDFTLHELRSTLGEEIRRLEQVPEVDISEIYLRLDGLKRQLGTLLPALPEFGRGAPAAEQSVATTVPDPGDAPQMPVLPSDAESSAFQAAGATSPTNSPQALASVDQTSSTVVGPDQAEAVTDVPLGGETGTDGDPRGFLQTLADEFGELLRFRRIDTGFKPSPTPTEAAYLEINLRLILEQTQLAALRRDQNTYAGSLAAALEWANAHLDRQTPEVREAIATLEALQNLQLAPPPPDISGSLRQLQALRQRSR